jgi:tRNA uridine 5-carboxymethylaminomethyl modification enzyme
VTAVQPHLDRTCTALAQAALLTSPHTQCLPAVPLTPLSCARLRADNADARLAPVAEAAGLLSSAHAQVFRARQEEVAAWRAALESAALPGGAWRAAGVIGAPEGSVPLTAAALLLRPGVELREVAAAAATATDSAGDMRSGSGGSGGSGGGCAALAALASAPGGASRSAAAAAAADLLYAPYEARASEEVAALRADEALELPLGLDYASMRGLCEADRALLAAARPATLAAAGRVPGVGHGALVALLAAARPRRGAEGGVRGGLPRGKQAANGN